MWTTGRCWCCPARTRTEFSAMRKSKDGARAQRRSHAPAAGAAWSSCGHCCCTLRAQRQRRGAAAYCTSSWPATICPAGYGGTTPESRYQNGVGGAWTIRPWRASCGQDVRTPHCVRRSESRYLIWIVRRRLSALFFRRRWSTPSRNSASMSSSSTAVGSVNCRNTL